jgi:hypothetical protein
VSLQRTRFENHDRVVVTAGVVNHGKKPVPARRWRSSRRQRDPVAARDVAPGGSSSVTFTPFTVASRNMRGTVRLPADALKRDNVFHFVVSPSEPVHALVINRGGAESEALYPDARARRSASRRASSC